jgi:8-amino-7-oxononanoate synthase
MSLDDDARAALAALQAAGRWRARRTRTSSLAETVTLTSGATLIDFASNDYLGLSAHPALAAAAAEAAARYGSGAGASRLIIGDTGAHASLERALADWLGAPAVLSTATGYAANVGVVATLAGPDAVVFSDELNHASIIDGCRLGRAPVIVYRHGDLTDLATKLAAAPTGRRIVISESLFSMDGDIVDVAGLAALCTRHQATLVLDEAHAVGVVGPNGRGVAAEVGVRPDILVGTLGKAFGSAGAFVASSGAVIDWLWNRARPVVFSTGIAPPVAASSEAALGIVASSEGDRLRQRLRAAGARVRGGLGLADAALGSPIVPIVVGDDRAAVARSEALEATGLLVPAIRPPTVPVGTARLRVSLSARHTDEQLTALLAALGERTSRMR